VEICSRIPERHYFDEISLFSCHSLSSEVLFGGRSPTWRNSSKTSYRPGGGETICPRRWLFDSRRISARPWTDLDGSAVRRWLSCRQPACLGYSLGQLRA